MKIPRKLLKSECITDQRDQNRLAIPGYLVVLSLLVSVLFSSSILAKPVEVQKIPAVEVQSPADNDVKAGAVGDQKEVQSIESVAKKGNKLTYRQHLALFCAATVLGLIVALAQILKKFHRFIGLGVLTNASTWLFLLLVFFSAALAYLGVFLNEDSIAATEVMANSTSWAGLIGSPIVGNLTATLLGLVGRMGRLEAGSIDDVKDLAKAKSGNFFFELIRNKIGERMDIEVAQMTREYDWDILQDTASHLIENEIALGRLKREKGEVASKYVSSFVPDPDKRKDSNNKYSAIHRVIQVSSFQQFQKRLIRRKGESG